MAAYRHVLVAVDLSPEAEQVFARACEIAADSKAHVTLTHVVEPVIADAGYDFIPAIPEDIESELLSQAREFLTTLAHTCPHQLQIKVERGSVKGELLRLAEAEKVDLIVIGTHGRHGVGLLLGSTANAVLHGTPCDVLAVRIGRSWGVGSAVEHEDGADGE